MRFAFLSIPGLAIDVNESVNDCLKILKMLKNTHKLGQDFCKIKMGTVNKHMMNM